MVRRVHVSSVAFGIAVLIVSHSFLDGRAPAFGQDVSKDAEAALRQRDRLWVQTHELRNAGKLAEAIAAAEAMLAIERKVLPADHANLAASLQWSAELYLEREDFAAAKTACREALEILLKRNGETHWKVADARRALENVDRRAGMTTSRSKNWARRLAWTTRSWPFRGRASLMTDYHRRGARWRCGRRCSANATATTPSAGLRGVKRGFAGSSPVSGFHSSLG